MKVLEASQLPKAASVLRWQHPSTPHAMTVLHAVDLGAIEGVVPNHHHDRHYILKVADFKDDEGVLCGYVRDADPLLTECRFGTLVPLKRPPPAAPPKSASVAALESLATLEHQFEHDPRRRPLMVPMWTPGDDVSPFGLTLLGANTFEPMFRTFRAVTHDRQALFDFAQNRLVQSLGAADDADLKALEAKTRTLWQAVHNAMLDRLS